MKFLKSMYDRSFKGFFTREYWVGVASHPTDSCGSCNRGDCVECKHLAKVLVK